jgi:hypothetical protein
MVPYKNLSGKSGVVAYENGVDYIIVQFKEGKETIYTYTYQSAGSSAIETMKRLAVAGTGLNSYVSTNKQNIQARNKLGLNR